MQFSVTATDGAARAVSRHGVRRADFQAREERARRAAAEGVVLTDPDVFSESPDLTWQAVSELPRPTQSGSSRVR